MKFLFITRCRNNNNIYIIKNNIRNIFENTGETYTHHIICDLTCGSKEEDFKKFYDKNTNISFVFDKGLDKYCSRNIDDSVSKYDDDYWVHILDDDNLLKENFLSVKQYCNDCDMIIFDVDAPEENSVIRKPRNLSVNRCVGKIDFCNYIVKNSVAKNIGFYCNKSFSCDGEFVKKCIQNNIKIINTEKNFGYYNKLRY